MLRLVGGRMTQVCRGELASPTPNEYELAPRRRAEPIATFDVMPVGTRHLPHDVGGRDGPEACTAIRALRGVLGSFGTDLAVESKLATILVCFSHDDPRTWVAYMFDPSAARVSIGGAGHWSADVRRPVSFLPWIRSLPGRRSSVCIRSRLASSKLLRLAACASPVPAAVAVSTASGSGAVPLPQSTRTA